MECYIWCWEKKYPSRLFLCFDLNLSDVLSAPKSYYLYFRNPIWYLLVNQFVHVLVRDPCFCLFLLNENAPEMADLRSNSKISERIRKLSVYCFDISSSHQIISDFFYIMVKVMTFHLIRQSRCKHNCGITISAGNVGNNI